MNKRGNIKQSDGFTLIEVLVSLTLLIIVLGAVYSTFFSVQRAIDRFDNISLKYHEVRTTLDIMRREIEASLLKNLPQGEEDESKPRAEFIIKDRDSFGKSTSSLDLTSFSFKGSGLNTVSYFVNKEEHSSLNLVKSEKPSIIKSNSYTMIMIEDIEGFAVETLFNNKWVKTWDTANTGRLPGIVRISIEFIDNGKIIKLTEYARPKVGESL